MGRGLCVSGDLNQVTSGGVFNTFWEMSPATFGVLHREHGDFGVSPWSFTQVLEMIFLSGNPEFFEETSSLNGHPNLEAHLEKN